jgi:hypothetical protein
LIVFTYQILGLEGENNGIGVSPQRLGSLGWADGAHEFLTFSLILSIKASKSVIKIEALPHQHP